MARIVVSRGPAYAPGRPCPVPVQKPHRAAPRMIEGHRFWIDLLNAQDSWVTDDSMLSIVPEEAREFESAADWPRPRALAFLNNNSNALRLNYARLEAGQPLDLDLLNPVLAGVSLRILDWRRRPDFP